MIQYTVALGGVSAQETPRIHVVLLDADGNIVTEQFKDQHDKYQGTLEVPDARLWWPYLMDSDPGYLYTLQVKLSNT